MRTTLEESKRLYHEDNFATTAQLNMVWPTLEQYTDDAYALNVLAELISRGKNAPLYKVLEKAEGLSSSYYSFNRSAELAGVFRISVTANDGKSLKDVEAGVNEAFALFEKDGVTDRDIARVKAGLETGFV